MNQRRSFLKLVSLASAGALLPSRGITADIGTLAPYVRPGTRKVVLEVGTTGLGSARGHRIIEIAAVEIVGREITGHCFHTYCDPERDLSRNAVGITGLTREFLTGKPKFREVINALMQFIGDAPLVIHNAPFDQGFLDAELERLGREPVFRNWPSVIDTHQIARAQGLKWCRLSYLCTHYGIPIDEKSVNTGLDLVEVVARVYLALTV